MFTKPCLKYAANISNRCSRNTGQKTIGSKKLSLDYIMQIDMILGNVNERVTNHCDLVLILKLIKESSHTFK